MGKKTFNAASTQERQVVGVEDLVLLSSLSNEEISKNLKKRFAKDEIYTYIGPVLIACNPFRWLRLYEASHVKMHENANRADLAPHIYAVAEGAFRNMVGEEDKQCVIISGESGAGKTEAAKQIMSYIAAVSGSGGNDQAVTEVKNIVLDSNPVLEAFGNAMTLRNNNSSRFGKYFELRFDLANGGTPRGGRITNYLLEKSRVVKPGPGERSFHIFYQLLSGAPRDLKQSLGLSSPEDFAMLRMSGVTRIDNEGGRTDDAKEFADTLHSFETIGMRSEQQFAMFNIVAIVLHLSNIEFKGANVEGADGSYATDKRAVEYAAGVMGVDAQQLEYALTYRTLTTMAPGGAVETYQVPQNPHQARSSRDALAKDLYFRMFDVIVGKVNAALEQCGQNTRLSMRRAARQVSEDDQLSIGVLDIYGFEIFETNSFEQFCINYVNEKLQQIFIELTLRAEQEEYASEGIQWTPIPFFDNKVVCELIESKRPPGVFAILDDTCKSIHAGGNVDDQFLSKLKSFQGTHKHYSAFRGGFQILHYAGEVNYTAEGFIEANKDTLFQHLQLLCQSSSVEAVRNLYPEEVNVDQRRQPTTAGHKIKTQCGDLVYTLMDCTPHYVRCIKSNDQKKAGLFDDQRVLHQTRYLGLLENVKVRRAGFAYRMEFFRFIARFKVLGAGQLDARVLAHGTDYEIAAAILNASVSRVPQLTVNGETQLGRTKVFIKSPETYFALQEQRKTMVNKEVVKIQNAWRRFVSRKDLVNLRLEMAELFNEKQKQSTPADLLRPYYSTYINDQNMKLAISNQLEKYQLSEIKMERMLYCDQVLRMNKDKKWEKLVFVITDKAFYLSKYVPPLTDADRAKKKKKVKRKDAEAHLVLRRRTELKQIESLSLSQEADDWIVIQCKPQEKLKKPPKKGWVEKGKVKRCMETQEPFSFFGKKKHRCHETGRIYIQDVTKNKVALPDRGFYSPVEVHDSVVGTVSTEMREDVILNTDKKAEVAAVLRDLVTRARGGGGPSKDTPLLAKMGVTGKAKPMAKALYDYDASQNDELSLVAGETIELTDSSNPDWWLGKKNGKRGCFPAAYVQKLAAQTVHKPTRANPRRYLCPINFGNMIPIRQATVSSLSNTPKGMLKFAQDPNSSAIRIKVSGGNVNVLVPPGVAGQKLMQIQRNQEERLARREAERQELYELRRANAQKREAERAAERDRRLANKKEKKRAEREKRNKQREVENFASKNAQNGGASFAARIANQRAGGGSTGGSSAPPWARNNGGSSGGGAVRMNGSSGYQAAQAFKAPAAKPKPPPSKPKPSAWEAFTDDDSGDTYYYNNETGESQWDPPPGFNSSSQAMPAGAGQMSYNELLSAKNSGAHGLDASRLEVYLAPNAYPSAFGMSKAEFDGLANWKKTEQKRKAKLY